MTWTPTLAEIGAAVPLRTRVTDGAYATTDQDSGTFSSSTTPTDTQVNVYLAGVQADVSARAGTIPASLEPLAKWVTILGVAAQIEEAYPAPDGVDVAATFRAQYESELATLIGATTAAGAGPTGAALVPQWSYPPVNDPAYPPVTTIFTNF
jgi:hypothetical protein